MKLRRGENVYAKYAYQTVPDTAPTEWEAQIDGTGSWYPTVAVDEGTRLGLLVAHPDYDGDSAGVVLTRGRHKVRLRIVDNPETETTTDFVIDVEN